MNHIHKIKRHFVHHKKKHISLGLLFITLAFIVGGFMITRGTTPYISELAITEHSVLGKSAGSVIPASGESYPTYDYPSYPSYPTYGYPTYPTYAGYPTYDYPTYGSPTYGSPTYPTYGSPTYPSYESYESYESYPTAPDLIAGTVSQTVAAVGDVTTLSATISNPGTATGASFSNFIQVATAPGGGGNVIDLDPTTMTALGSGGSALTSQSYTFTSSGIHSVRACADKSDRNNAGAVAESNESNNCGAWTNISANYPAVVGLTLTGNHTSPGNISFSCANSNRYSILRDGTSLADQVYSGAINYSVTVAGNYSVSCSRGTVSDTGVVSYDPLPPIPSNFSLSATPRSIIAGAKVTLEWGITDPNNSCRLIATPICTGVCDAAHTNAAAALQTILDTGTTDNNDPYGASRSMTSAIQTPYLTGGTKAQGKKTIQMQYSTDFKLKCGPAVASTTIRVIVTSANEG